MNDFFYDPWLLILFFFIPGAMLGALYDIFRILRIARTDPKGSVLPKLCARLGMERKRCLREEKRKAQIDFWLVFAEDLLFCLIAALTELLLFFHLNDGVIRAPGLFLSALGFFAYRLTLGTIVIGTATRLIQLARRLSYLLLFCICAPVVWMGRTSRKLIVKCQNKKRKTKPHEKQGSHL